MNTENPMVLAYGDFSFDFTTLPNQSVRAMLSRGLTHFLGSEQASKIGPNSGWQAKFEKDNGRKPNDAEVAAQKAANLANAAKALTDGTVGTARGPKLDPIEAEMDRIAEREVWDTLAGANLCKKNKKPKDEDEFTFANGDKFTFETLIERRLEKHGDRVKAEATKKVNAEAKQREAAKAKAAKAAEAGPVDAEQLGL